MTFNYRNSRELVKLQEVREAILDLTRPSGIYGVQTAHTLLSLPALQWSDRGFGCGASRGFCSLRCCLSGGRGIESRDWVVGLAMLGCCFRRW